MALLADGGVAVLVRLECASVLADVLIITYPGSVQLLRRYGRRIWSL